jgi:hypothetical protein
MSHNGLEIFGWIETGQGIILDPYTKVAFFLAVLENTHEKTEDLTSRFEAFPDFKGFVGPGRLHSHLHIYSNCQMIKVITGVAVYKQSPLTMPWPWVISIPVAAMCRQYTACGHISMNSLNGHRHHPLQFK